MENLVTLSQLSQYYRNRNVLVTGHTGFKGAWLCAVLHLLGARTFGYSLAPAYTGGLYDYLEKEQLVDSTIGDIRNKATLQALFQKVQPDFVFHLAAQPLVRYSYRHPSETFDVNVVGTANVLECIKELNHKCSVIVITTDKVYENREQDILYKEEDALGDYDPYSASKACAELVASSFRSSFFNQASYAVHGKSLVTARAGNVIGGGDWSEDRIIPDIVRALKNKETIPIRNPAAVRPWQHVLEPVAGYLQLGGLLSTDPQRYSKPYNFGPQPQDHLSVGELVEHAVGTWGSGQWVDQSDSHQPHEAGLLKLDISRAINELGWKPRLDARSAIRWTLDWYKQPEAGLLKYSFEQVEKYFSL